MRKARLVAVGATLALGSMADTAAAQIRWDLGLAGGVKRRILTSRPTGAPDAEFGPSLEAQAHVAVRPLLRAGVWANFESSPLGDGPARHIVGGGIRGKFLPPWPRDPWRAWIFAGLGYSGAYAPSFTSTTSDGSRLFVQGTSGGFLEVPVGVGLGWRFRRPFEITAEFGVRFGAGFHGDLYDTRGRGGTVTPAGSTAPAEARVAPSGQDSIGLGLSLGLALDL